MRQQRSGVNMLKLFSIINPKVSLLFFEQSLEKRFSYILASKKDAEILHNNSIYPLDLLYQAHFIRLDKINLLGNSGKIKHIFLKNYGS
jgi:hypothetical protein